MNLFAYMPSKRSTTPLSARLCLMLLLLPMAVLFSACGNKQKTEDSIEQIVNEAAASLSIYDFKNAYSLLADVQPGLPRSNPHWEEATYLLALAAWHISPPDSKYNNQARDLLEVLASSASNPQLIAYAKLDLGRLYEVSDYADDVKNVEKARSYYRDILENPVSEALAYQATLRLAQTYRDELDEAGTEKAISLIKAIVNKYPENSWKSVACQYLGDLYAEQEQYAEALNAYGIAKERGFAIRSKTDIYLWRMGIFAERSGQPSLAMEYFSEVVTEYPRSVYGTVARDRIAAYVKANPGSKFTVPELGALNFGGKKS